MIVLMTATPAPERVKRRSKIVCTLGPSTQSPERVDGLLRAGMDVARFNLAHGTLDYHARLIALVRETSHKLGLPTAILVDCPGLKRGVGSMKDVFGEHLRFALSQNATFVALSFISTADQVVEVQGLLRGLGAATPVIVKIEQAAALEGIDGILEACQGIMVARGDLALEISIEKVPLAQKHLVTRATQHGKPVIVATEMLESMVRSPSPTRAEATDVANAVLDGTDAVMLSEETAIGQHPEQAVAMMGKIAAEAETGYPHERILEEGRRGALADINDASARAACEVAEQLKARAIVTFTAGGTTPWRLSRYRPRQPIIAATASEDVMRRLSLAWGVTPMTWSVPLTLEDVFEECGEICRETGVAKPGELIVVAAGLPLSVPGITNLVKVHRA